MQNVIDIDYIKNWIASHEKYFKYLNGEYENAFSKLIFKCEKCNEEFISYWGTIYTGTGCPYCAGKKIGKTNSLAFKFPYLVNEWDWEKNKETTPYNIFPNMHKKVWWKCLNGHEWEASPNNRCSKNSSCPYCTNRLPTNENNLFLKYPDICEEWNYEKNKNNPSDYLPYSLKKVFWTCSKCKISWKSRIANRTKNLSGCPNCSNSKGEEMIFKTLLYMDIDYNQHYSFHNCRLKHSLPFDFYIPEYNTCIEYYGIQHYEPIMFFGGEKAFLEQKKRDDIKKHYCANNGINFVVISYKEFDNIDNIIKTNIAVIAERI